MSTALPELPEGYCLDPNGRVCVPNGREADWSFGYECGYQEAMGTKMRAIRAYEEAAIAADRAARDVPITWIPDWSYEHMVSGSASNGPVMHWSDPQDKTGLVPLCKAKE